MFCSSPHFLRKQVNWCFFTKANNSAKEHEIGIVVRVSAKAAGKHSVLCKKGDDNNNDEVVEALRKMFEKVLKSNCITQHFDLRKSK